MLGTSHNPLSVLHRKRIQPWLRRAQLGPFTSMNLPPRSQQALSAEVLQRGTDELETIWLDYLANGGNAVLAEFHGYLHGNLEMPHFERRALEHTLWELRHLPAGADLDCCGEAGDSVASAGRLVSAPSPDLLAALIGRSSPTALREVAAFITRAGREQLDRISARSHWRHRRYVGW